MRHLLTAGALILTAMPASAVAFAGEESLRRECAAALIQLVDALLTIQDLDATSPHYGALHCQACGDRHTRAGEAVLPFAVAYRETGDRRYLTSALAAGDWLIAQQQADGSWLETPSQWTGTTTDQLLMLASALPILTDHLSPSQRARWVAAIKKAADWLVANMNHEFASINYCATSAATLTVANQVVADPAYVAKAKELARLVTAKFDGDYFLTGEGNRIRGTKYGVDSGYNLDMSLWGLGLYARLADDRFVDRHVRQSLKRQVYFIWPDGSTDNSWGVRSSKWTTYGSFTADGCQILFSLYAAEDPVYRTAALANLRYFMSLREGGFITYGPAYSGMFRQPPCIYPTFCRAKNLALAILHGDQTTGDAPPLPTQTAPWARYFPTVDVALVRTESFMATIAGYRYKDIRQGADFKYMHRPTGGSVTNLWAPGYGYLQASGQTEYHRWEMNYPEVANPLTISPRIEFTDADIYYSNLYEFDARMDLSQEDGQFIVKASGELKDRNRWEGGVAYELTHAFAERAVTKSFKLRYHGRRPTIRIVEPFVVYPDVRITLRGERQVEIEGKGRRFIFEVLSDNGVLEVGRDAARYAQPFPALKGYPVTLVIDPPRDAHVRNIELRIRQEVK